MPSPETKKFKVKFRLVSIGEIEVEAADDMAAGDEVEWMDGAELFNEHCNGFDSIEVTDVEEVKDDERD